MSANAGAGSSSAPNPEPDAKALHKALAAALAWLRRERAPAKVIGGAAVTFWLSARTTRDVGFVALLSDEFPLPQRRRAERCGLRPRMETAWEFAKRHRVLLLEHVETTVPVDVSLAGTKFEVEALRAPAIVRTPGLRIPAARPEHLLVFKMIARRPIDLADVAALLRRRPPPDLQGPRRWLAELAELADDPDLLPEFERMVEQSRR